MKKRFAPSAASLAFAAGLPMIGVATPWLGYTLLGLTVALLILPAWPWLRRRSAQNLSGGRVSTPPSTAARTAPRRTRPTAIRIGKGADDATIEDSLFVGDIDGIVNEGGKRMRTKGNRFYNSSRLLSKPTKNARR